MHTIREKNQRKKEEKLLENERERHRVMNKERKKGRNRGKETVDRTKQIIQLYLMFKQQGERNRKQLYIVIIWWREPNRKHHYRQKDRLGHSDR